MKVTIGEREYDLNFGWGFLEYVNIELGVESQGQKTELGGMYNLYMGVAMTDPKTLVHIIKAGTVTEKQKPSNKGIQEFIEELLDAGEAYEEFYLAAWEEVKKKPLLRKALGEGLTEDYLQKVETGMQ